MSKNVEAHTGYSHAQVYLVGQEKPKTNKQTKGIFIWKAEILGEQTTQPSNFPLKGKDGNGEEMGEKVWNRLSIYTGPKRGGGADFTGFQHCPLYHRHS